MATHRPGLRTHQRAFTAGYRLAWRAQGFVARLFFVALYQTET